MFRFLSLMALASSAIAGITFSPQMIDDEKAINNITISLDSWDCPDSSTAEVFLSGDNLSFDVCHLTFHRNTTSNSSLPAPRTVTIAGEPVYNTPSQSLINEVVNARIFYPGCTGASSVVNRNISLSRRVVPGKFARSYGDPHYTTFSSQDYNFQTPGDHVLTVANSFIVQARIAECASLRVGSTTQNATCNSAIALQYGASVIIFSNLGVFANRHLNQFAQIYNNNGSSSYEVHYADKTRVVIGLNPFIGDVSVNLFLPAFYAGSVMGQFNTFEKGSASSSSGFLLPGGARTTDAQRFAASWRVTGNSSLFDLCVSDPDCSVIPQQFLQIDKPLPGCSCSLPATFTPPSSLSTPSASADGICAAPRPRQGFLPLSPTRVFATPFFLNLSSSVNTTAPTNNNTVSSDDLALFTQNVTLLCRDAFRSHAAMCSNVIDNATLEGLVTNCAKDARFGLHAAIDAGARTITTECDFKKLGDVISAPTDASQQRAASDYSAFIANGNSYRHRACGFPRVGQQCELNVLNYLNVTLLRAVQNATSSSPTFAMSARILGPNEQFRQWNSIACDKAVPPARPIAMPGANTGSFSSGNTTTVDAPATSLSNTSTTTSEPSSVPSSAPTLVAKVANRLNTQVTPSAAAPVHSINSSIACTILFLFALVYYV